MFDRQAALMILRDRVDPTIADVIADLIENGRDAELNRANPIGLARKRNLDETLAIDGFVHATRLGLFELSWNVVCPGCGGVLLAAEHLSHLERERYTCALCAADCRPGLDESVEVTFTVNPAVRAIAAHRPESMSSWDYARQLYWGSESTLPEDIESISRDALIGVFDLPPGRFEAVDLDLAPGLVIVFDPVTHTSSFIEISGASASERQDAACVIPGTAGWTATANLRPGPARLIIENQTGGRALPTIWRAGDALVALVSGRQPTLDAKRLLSNQTFRDIHGATLFDPHQRFQIKSLTFVFSDITGSSALYERVGDLAAFDLVRAHFRALEAIIARYGGAVVKTIGDAVMASFADPLDAVKAALAMRGGIHAKDTTSGDHDIVLKIGVHAGPCLAVILNNHQDYFGQTVNAAARIQSLARPDAIVLSQTVASTPGLPALLSCGNMVVERSMQSLRGMERKVEVLEIRNQQAASGKGGPN
ncbi:adenylate/guanylate cyclase domain-containing protein [Rhizobium gallicum]|nr:adenylate/guanylate cyclase domain-containing protein [Rhizobium gallicum]